MSETIPKDGNSRINLIQFKNIEQYVKKNVKVTCENMKLVRMSFSRDFPSERYNGIMNLYYVILCPHATMGEANIVMVKYTFSAYGSN